MNARQLMLVVLAVLALAFLAVSPAAAAENKTTAEDERNCSDQSLLIYLNDQCSPHYGEGYVVVTEDGKQTFYDGVPTDGRTDEQVHYDVFADGLLMADATKQHRKESISHTNQTVALAYSEAWNAVVKVRNDDGSKSTALQAANDAINDFYTMQQKSLYTQQNRQALRLKVMNQTVNETENLGRGDIFLVETQYWEDDFVFNERNATLWNGTTMNVTEASFIYATDDGFGDTYIDSYTAYSGELNDVNTTDYPEQYNNQHYFLQIKDPDGETITIMDGREYNKTYRAINDNRQQALDNVDKLVDGVWANCDVGECQPQDAGPIHLIYSMSSDYDSTGHYAPAAALLGSAGYAGNGTMAYNVTWTNAYDNGTELPTQTATGQMWWTDGTFENSTVETGVTYNDSDLNGSVYYMYQDGTIARETTFNHTFVVNEMWNMETDEKVNKTTKQGTSFNTTDTSDLNPRVQELLQKMADLENQVESNPDASDDDDGGGGALPGGTTRILLVVLIIAAVIAIFAAIGGGGGGGRNGGSDAYYR